MPNEFTSSWLVQRLEKPRNGGILGDNPFSFGGGLRNGGLSDEAMSHLRWLEIDNGFMFFTDHTMYSGTADLFGVPR